MSKERKISDAELENVSGAGSEIVIPDEKPGEGDSDSGSGIGSGSESGGSNTGIEREGQGGPLGTPETV